LVLIDESGVMLAPLRRRTLAPRGHPPILKQAGRHREKVSLIGALSLSPRRRHLGLYFSTLVNDNFEQSAVAWFLRQLLRALRGPIIVVFDRGNMHRGPEIRKLLHDHPRLALETLPPYAPELNPVEQIWSYLKWGQLSNFAPQNVVHLEKQAFTTLHRIRYDQKRLRSFWNGSELPWPTRAIAS
jgi:putative transposase